jgi:hypothetical protein
MLVFYYIMLELGSRNRIVLKGDEISSAHSSPARDKTEQEDFRETQGNLLILNTDTVI